MIRRLNIKLDAELHRQLKMLAAGRGETIQAIMTALVKLAVERANKRP